ncbi:MAG: 3-phosphoshikimate 1-carboxyvinyltransferase [Actinomycetota bacterium]
MTGTAPTSLTLDGPRSLRGTLRVPGDKSISHRVLLLASVADGRSRLRGLSDGDDVARTRAAIGALGATVTDEGDAVVVEPGAPVSPDEPVDLGNSGTGIRLLAGLCAGRPLTVELTGDESLRGRPMDRIAEPLRRMGATITGPDDGRHPPLVVTGGGLRGIEYATPVASAQVKSAVLLAGLGADGPTTVTEPSPSRAHTEELLVEMGADLTVEDTTTVLVPGPLRPLDHTVAGDPSQAAFWVVAALIAEDSDVTVEGAYLGPARAGFLDVLERMGADLEIDRDAGSVRARSSRLRGTRVDAEEIPGLDEIPVLAVAAAVADGETAFVDMGELRVKESDRLRTTAALLRSFAADVAIDGDHLRVAGGARFGSDATVDAGGDHRIAMAGAVAAVASAGATRIDGWDMVATSYPGFESDLEHLTAHGEGVR